MNAAVVPKLGNGSELLVKSQSLLMKARITLRDQSRRG